jgi:hypothetical protein
MATLPAGVSIFRMNETRLHASLRNICKDLSDVHAAYALVGGLAVSARTEPRFTKDLDVAIAVANDREAESLIRSLATPLYRVEALVEHETAARLATVRLIPSMAQRASGRRRRSSSKKLIRNVTWLGGDCVPGASAGTSAAMRLESGARL